MQQEHNDRERTVFPRGLWRRKYECRRLRGDHEFVLVKPKLASVFIKSAARLTVEEYYAADSARIKKIKNEITEKYKDLPEILTRTYIPSVWMEWECRGCGKRESEIEGREPNKNIKIRL